MNVSTIGTQPVAPATTDKRAQLQLLLLQKSLQLQKAETEAALRETEGKGERIDIRA